MRDIWANNLYSSTLLQKETVVKSHLSFVSSYKRQNFERSTLFSRNPRVSLFVVRYKFEEHNRRDCNERRMKKSFYLLCYSFSNFTVIWNKLTTLKATYTKSLNLLLNTLDDHHHYYNFIKQLYPYFKIEISWVIRALYIHKLHMDRRPDPKQLYVIYANIYRLGIEPAVCNSFGNCAKQNGKQAAHKKY